MAQIQKKKKECRPGLEKETLQKIFFISVVTIAREMPKIIKGKNPDRMCLLIFLKIYPQQQKQWHKNSLYFSIYLLGMSNHISKFIFKTSKYPFVASLF